MKTHNNFFLLLAAATLTIGTAAAQTTPNAKPAVQRRAVPTPRPVYDNGQISATSRAAAIDNQSYVGQVGLSNWAVVRQTGTRNKADMIQVNLSSSALGNDGYQTQVGLENDAYMVQIGVANYADQDQRGIRNVALVQQGELTGLVARSRNYAVQEQEGAHNYAYIDQDSDRNFAHQSQESSLLTSIGGGLAPSSSANGNWVETRQGGSTSILAGNTDGQWSQVVQDGQNNRASVRQDHP